MEVTEVYTYTMDTVPAMTPPATNPYPIDSILPNLSSDKEYSTLVCISDIQCDTAGGAKCLKVRRVLSTVPVFG